MKLADLRKSYELGALHEEDVAKDPLVQIDVWLKEAEAAGVAEFNAMTLSTVGSDGRPSSRIVLVKGVDTGLVWYTNYQSRKADELAIHPFACLQFHFIAQERQMRIEGVVEKVSAAQSDAYFASRPRASKIGAWASPQSKEIANRDVLAKAEAELALEFGEQIPRPSHWGGYRLKPDRVEFWQGRPSRLHDRLLYRRSLTGSWDICRLAP